MENPYIKLNMMGWKSMDNNDFATKEDMLELVGESVANLNNRIDVLNSIVEVLARNIKLLLDIHISNEDDGDLE